MTQIIPKQQLVLVSFYERLIVGEDAFRYVRFFISGPTGDGRLHTFHPPLVNDLIHLSDNITYKGAEKKSGVFVVRERCWLHSSWGSMDWPYQERISGVGPHLDIIVERATGLFRNEAPTEE